jgi:hypothetical protein
MLIQVKSYKRKGKVVKSYKKKLLKRADGSYSKRGLWDNIRANEGSNKKPSKELLKQANKINNANNS